MKNLTIDRVLSLALIGNASGTGLGRSRISLRGVFDETSCASGAPPGMKMGFSVLATWRRIRL